MLKSVCRCRQDAFIVKTRSPSVLFDLIQRTKDAVRELDSQIGSRFKKLLVESPAANHHGPGTHQHAAAMAADIDDDDDDDAADDSSVSDTCWGNGRLPLSSSSQLVKTNMHHSRIKCL